MFSFFIKNRRNIEIVLKVVAFAVIAVMEVVKTVMGYAKQQFAQT